MTPDGSLVTGGADASIQLWPGALKSCLGYHSDPSQSQAHTGDLEEVTGGHWSARFVIRSLGIESNSIRCVYISCCCHDCFYLFTDKGCILQCRVDETSLSYYHHEAVDQASIEGLSVTDLYRDSLSGSFICGAVAKVELRDDESVDLIVAGGSKGFVLLLLANAEG